jgi:penicillin-insensitive murein endopeptidase
MILRYAALFGFTAAFVVGGIAAVEYVKHARAQAPGISAPGITVTPAPQTPTPKAAEPAPPEASPPLDVTAPDTAAKPAESPALEPGETPAPVVTAPSTPEPATPSAPVVTAPPVQTPAPVVTAPSATPDKPADKKNAIAAKTLFSAVKLPTLGQAMAIGYYPRGCLQGGVELPVNGPTWQVMRLSRNRNWGHPSLVRFLEKFAPAAAKATGWKGILVGDMAQPRGGPLPFGHLSHQIGLDVDIWFMPMPDHTLTPEEREKISASNLVADDWKHLNPKTWTPQHVAFIKTAAEQPNVERVLVNAAIKKELCRVDPKASWLAKVRPWYGHHDHIHVRLACPADSPSCRKQPPVTGDDGCSDKALAYWFSDKVLRPAKAPPTTPAKPPKPVTLADMPPACKNVLDAPAKQASKAN